jgi:hypothetical protein
MKRSLVSTTLFLALALALSLAAVRAFAASAASAAQPGAPAAAPGKAPAPTITPKIAVHPKLPPGLRADLQHELDESETELVALASAVPQEKFTWRPAPGVRSFGEVFLHVARLNYVMGKPWGVQPPPNLDLAKIEQQGADKGNAIAAMRVSFERVRQAIAAMSDADLDKPAEGSGEPGTVRAAMLAQEGHIHEHLGQAIAYARVNGVVPPWTAQKHPEAKP